MLAGPEGTSEERNLSLLLGVGNGISCDLNNDRIKKPSRSTSICHLQSNDTTSSALSSPDVVDLELDATPNVEPRLIISPVVPTRTARVLTRISPVRRRSYDLLIGTQVLGIVPVDGCFRHPLRVLVVQEQLVVVHPRGELAIPSEQDHTGNVGLFVLFEIFTEAPSDTLVSPLIVVQDLQ